MRSVTLLTLVSLALITGGCVSPPGDSGYPSGGGTSSPHVPRVPTVPQAPVMMSTIDPTNSYIHGDFKGWDGHSAYQLENGQLWRQKDYQYRYIFIYRPEVTVYKGAYGNWYMSVDGDNGDPVEVERLR